MKRGQKKSISASCLLLITTSKPGTNTSLLLGGGEILSSVDEPESEAMDGPEHAALITFFLLTSSAIKT